MKTQNVKEFVTLLNDRLEKDSVAVLTGAGLSTASGVPDFRGKNGLYTKDDSVEYKLSRRYFLDSPAEFYEFFTNNMLLQGIKPNLAHYMISDLEKEGYLTKVITQNIDGLDRLAGTKNIVEAHGNAQRFRCDVCKTEYSIEDYLNAKDIPPVCNHQFSTGKVCNGIIRPDIVLYDEMLDYNNIISIKEGIQRAKTLLILGTGLSVYPICDFVAEYLNEAHLRKNGHMAFIVNMGMTKFDLREEVLKYDGDIIEFTKEFNSVRSRK